MSDDLIPSMPSQNRNDKSAEGKTASECGNNPKNNTDNGKMDLFWFILTISWAAIEGGVAWLFWWLSGILEEHDCILLSDVSEFLTGSFILAIIAHGVFRAWNLKKPHTAKWVWLGYGIVEIVLLFILILIFSNKPIEPNSQPAAEWQPPEIPNDYPTAFLQIGDGSWTINLNDLKSGKPFEIPSFVRVHLINNRLYVESDVGWFNGVVHYESTEMISGPNYFDKQSNLAWDRNFSPTVFEVVNQDTNPIFQIIYNRPNFISLNGVFAAVPTNENINIPGLRPGQFLLAFSFGTNFEVYAADDKTAAQIVRIVVKRYKTFRIFNYPSYDHQGKYAN